MFYRTLALLCLLLSGMPLMASPDTKLHHRLQVQLSPESAELRAEDRLTLPRPVSELTFLLHGDLSLDTPTGQGSRRVTASDIERDEVRSWVPLQRYRVHFPEPVTEVTLNYRGRISHSLQGIGNDYAGGRDTTPGTISSEGVFLSAGSFWYPQVEQALISFDLQVALPEGWHSVSQGKALGDNHWQERQPQDEIYLIAAPFHVYTRSGRVARSQVYLRQADDELARRYLTATNDYLELYQRLIGDYPYDKFALVENFWESGYGMPSFTLLGPQVIRLPFIINTSYPHEILHNWWGNSVYVDYDSGNWAEGLTSYLADHLLKEQLGLGAEYRRGSLQKYADYVAEEDDFPLTGFRSHHGERSQAVGYSKALMFFHMLRLRIGDQAFIEGIRRFYRDNRFRTAGYADLRSAFEAVSGLDLQGFFAAWTERKGAPRLAVEDVEVIRRQEGYRLTGLIHQTQQDDPFPLDIPLLIQTLDSEEPQLRIVRNQDRYQPFNLSLASRPIRVMVDPRFETFRQLEPEELPASLGQLFGARELTLVLPSRADDGMKTAYRQLANAWSAQGADVEILWDTRLNRLPDGDVWLFGKENRLIGRISEQLQRQQIKLSHDRIDWQEKSHPLSSHSLALAVEPEPGRTVGLLASPTPETLKLLARKAPHYGRYSYTLFTGESVSNILKGQWQVSDSPLMVKLIEDDIPPVKIPPRTSLDRALR